MIDKQKLYIMTANDWKELGARDAYTVEEKKTIKEYATKNGIEIRRRCKDCWHDAVLQLYKLAAEAEGVLNEATQYGGGEKVVFVRGRRVKIAEIMDDEDRLFIQRFAPQLLK